MQRLDPQSTLQVYGEASGWPMIMGSLQVYDPSTSPGGLDLERVRDLYTQRLPHLPVFRQRLVLVPGGLGPPLWVEDPSVNVAAHVTAVTVESPGTDEQLGALAGRLMQAPMDRTRPLWDSTVIDGLSGGRVAVLNRLHHAAVDGVRGMKTQAGFFDAEPAAPFTRPGFTEGAGVGMPSTLGLFGGALTHLAGSPVRLARTAGRIASSAGRVAVGAARGREAGFALPVATPRTRFNSSITDRREVGFVTVPLEPIKRFAKSEGGTVNDAVLVLIGGALRRYLEQRGELPQRSLTTSLPVGKASADPSAAVGNRWSVITASLATTEADPVERLRAVMRSTRAGKQMGDAMEDDIFADLVDVPPVVVATVARSLGRLRLASLFPPMSNVVISNVRGAPFPLFFAGARLLANYPLGPLADGLALNVTVIGYSDSLDFGLHVCPDAVPDVWSIVAAVREESAALADLVPDA